MGFQWKQDIIEEAVQRFQGAKSSVRQIGGRYKNVFLYERGGQECILKLIPFATKDTNLLRSELEWMRFLSKHGIDIPKAIHSTNGQTIEVIRRLPVPCCAISFQKADGYHITKFFDLYWNEIFFSRWGKLMGMMHSLTPQFQTHQIDLIFEEWNEGELFYRDLSHLPRLLHDRWVQMLDQLSQMPKTEESYGIIHNSLHPDHFHVTSQGSIILFQFNKAKYHWYLYDIAVTLHHALSYTEDSEDFTEWFLSSFTKGYIKHKSLPENWKEQLRFFLKYHRLYEEIYEFIFPPTPESTEEEEDQPKQEEKIVVTMESLRSILKEQKELEENTIIEEPEPQLATISSDSQQLESKEDLILNDTNQVHIESSTSTNHKKSIHKKIIKNSFDLYGSWD